MTSGAWKIAGDARLAEQACRVAERELADTVETRLKVKLGETPAFFKAGRLPARAGRRHAWRARLFGKPFPTLAEYQSLERLRASGLPAPRPLAAGALVESGRPTQQFLATELVAGARALSDVLRAAKPARREELYAGPARCLAKLHALGLAHRNPFPRNWLVANGKLYLVDAWRLGRARPGRGAAYDLACLLLEASATERDGALRAYAERRGGRGATSWAPAVAWAARGLRKRAAREARRRAARAETL